MTEPITPNYRVIELADLSGHSMVLWLFDQNLVDCFSVNLTASGFSNLQGVASFNSANKYPLLPELPEGWEQFGLIQSRDTTFQKEYIGNRSIAVTIGVRWVLAFRWQDLLQPYTALLEAQEKLKPDKLSLTPPLILPLIFTTRMARYSPLALGDDKALHRFLPLFYQTVETLYPLLKELYTLWISGSSQAAIRYRSTLPPASTPKVRRRRSQSNLASNPPPEALQPDRNTLDLLGAIVGQAKLDQLRLTERPELVIIRLLEGASTTLWQRPFIKGKADYNWVVEGLLPLYLWHSQLAGPSQPDAEHLASGSALLNYWLNWRQD
ncbi:MAG: hypothetical protein WCS37_11190 [Chloroflexota bacterium]|nr:hypothetical protein [Chloroflexota bacterium]